MIDILMSKYTTEDCLDGYIVTTHADILLCGKGNINKSPSQRSRVYTNEAKNTSLKQMKCDTLIPLVV